MSAEVACSERSAAAAKCEQRAATVEVKFESPPPAPVPVRQEFDPRARLRELALELVRTRNRRLLIEYLRLRRAAR
jgi:hypothetical protein